MSIRARYSLLILAFAVFTSREVALAADPGTPYPASAEASDQKAGSVLVYPYYTSSAAGPNAQNTRINITQTDTAAAARVHLFFINATGSIADSYICLAPKQTATFLANDVDPGQNGYIVAVAVDVNGCPVAANTLIGDESVKLATGHSSSINAYAFSALYSGTLSGCTSGSTSATIALDGASYNRAPRTVAIDKIRSRADGNDTILVLNRLGGNLGVSAPAIGTASGTLFDDTGTGYPFTFNGSGPQFRSTLSNSFPVTVPNFSTVIPAGRTGWMKMFGDADIALVGAVINYNPNAASAGNAFNGGHGLRALSVTPAASFIIPIFPPNC